MIPGTGRSAFLVVAGQGAGPYLGGVMPSTRERLRAGQVPLAAFVNLIPSAVVTQALAAAGADVVLIDQEHGPIGPESLHAMVQCRLGLTGK